MADLNLNPSVDRTMNGFMGRHAWINALHIVRSEPIARLLVVN